MCREFSCLFLESQIRIFTKNEWIVERETHIYLDIQGLKAAAQWNGRRIVHVGDKIRLAMNLNHLHLFDAVTRKSLY